MEQYCQSFYVTTVTGGNPAGRTQSPGGQFGGAGLEGFAGVGTGGFGQVGGGQQGQQAGGTQGRCSARRQLPRPAAGFPPDSQRRRQRSPSERNLTRLTTLLIDQPAPPTGDFLTRT
jgi:hypothetical protein